MVVFVICDYIVVKDKFIINHNRDFGIIKQKEQDLQSCFCSRSLGYCNWRLSKEISAYNS